MVECCKKWGTKMYKNDLSRGKKAALLRARQLTEFEWTPVCDVPTYTKQTGKTVLPAGKLVRGMVYSSVEPTDKFVCENISFETFSTIVNNPDSAIYRKDIAGHNNSWTYFGLVCNGFVRYALNIRRRYSTKRWLTIPGMRLVYEASQYTVDQMELCDILYAFGKGRNHVALVTDLLCDEKGKVLQVEISEALRPSCARRLFTPEEFYEKYKLFALCRYDYIDSVPEPDVHDSKFIGERLISQIPDIALDCGNKTNYRTYEDVVISVFKEGKNEIEIFKNDKLNEKINIMGKGNVTRKFERGYYTVKYINTGETLEFCVTDPEITHSVKEGMLTVNASACDNESHILYMEFREKQKTSQGMDYEQSAVKFYNPCCSSLSKVEELTDEEKEKGIFTRKIPHDAGNFKVYFENKYGIWTHTMIKI